MPEGLFGNIASKLGLRAENPGVVKPQGRSRNAPPEEVYLDRDQFRVYTKEEELQLPETQTVGERNLAAEKGDPKFASKIVVELIAPVFTIPAMRPYEIYIDDGGKARQEAKSFFASLRENISPLTNDQQVVDTFWQVYDGLKSEQKQNIAMALEQVVIRYADGMRLNIHKTHDQARAIKEVFGSPKIVDELDIHWPKAGEDVKKPLFM